MVCESAACAAFSCTFGRAGDAYGTMVACCRGEGIEQEERSVANVPSEAGVRLPLFLALLILCAQPDRPDNCFAHWAATWPPHKIRVAE
eukprot:4400361-Prymnesium_polylepis.1